MFTYMTHAAQASRGKGIQLEHQCLRRVQREAIANGVFVQPTGPWRVWALLGTLCAMTEAVQENLGGFSRSRVVLSMFLPCEDGLKSSRGLEEIHFPSPQLPWGWWCFVERAEQGWLCREDPARSGYLFLPSPWAADKGLVMDTKCSLSASTPAALGVLPEALGGDGQPGGCKGQLTSSTQNAQFAAFNSYFLVFSFLKPLTSSNLILASPP